MKKHIFLLFLFFAFALSQAQKKYIFNIELSHYNEAPTFKLNNGLLEYNGTDESEIEFFSRYEILNFYQIYPSSNRLVNLNMFTFVTYSDKLMNDLLVNFPEKFVRIEDLTDLKVELTNYYPNDYGISNPNFPSYFAIQKHLDYMNVPKAWDITTGDENVLVGISDARIEVNDLDFVNKVSLTQNYINSLPSNLNPNDIQYWHGTNSAGFSAGRGNNNHGGTGVCMDCDIVAGWYGYEIFNSNLLLEMAQSGVKVINMSWTYESLTPNFIQTWQNIINEVYEDYNVVFVAAAGNSNPFAKTLYGTNNGVYIYPNASLYGFPASYDNVISVMSVNHAYNMYEIFGTDSTEIPNSIYYNVPMSYLVKDLVCPRVIPNFNGSGINYSITERIDATNTHNDKVDICAPALEVMRYDKLILGQNIAGGGTSTSAPLVTGTIGLMYSVNSCLINSEVDDILKLTAKNLENVNGNQPYFGRIGAGKLETGDAVEFVNEMKKVDGNALIEGQDFWRFNFDLQHINNKLTISNQTFRDLNISNFIAKNEIRILPGTSIKPNSTGSFHLGINPNINVNCTPSNRVASSNEKNSNSTQFKKETILYPNPNNGSFSIDKVDFELFLSNQVKVFITDLNGRILFKDIISKNEINSYSFNLENKLSSGIYLLNLNSESYNKSIKFIIK